LLEVLEREAGHYEACYQLGVIAMEAEERTAAKGYFERALQIRPQFEAAKQALLRINNH